ncbi:LPS export ABC transporter periplasmic protein LptC [Suttonella sp. R2A3]|uniref:LPS export ABC transporter periplasmic protein LptC n=1 Tax=Suttonella sp. R2A3 TaxID=2908648 RepID=UPI001F447A66|nr:LPS export ABC transporter periplasmic protein LptC [Suttonella sp. R2A3]UJF24600.1 LPS export ABC transporter periplasmic protein LptC [Suttonella sp. R2A3]
MGKAGQVVWLILAVVVSLWWWTQLEDKPPTPVSDTSSPLLTMANASTYRYNTQGRQQSRLDAKTVRHFNDGQGTFFTQPDIRHIVADNAYTTIVSRQGYMSDDKNVITMRGDVIGERYVNQSLQTIYRSEVLDYRPVAQTVSSDKAVTILTPESDSDGLGALWRLDDNYFILEKNVRTHYAPSSLTPLSPARPE